MCQSRARGQSNVKIHKENKHPANFFRLVLTKFMFFARCAILSLNKSRAAALSSVPVLDWAYPLVPCAGCPAKVRRSLACVFAKLMPQLRDTRDRLSHARIRQLALQCVTLGLECHSSIVAAYARRLKLAFCLMRPALISGAFAWLRPRPWTTPHAPRSSARSPRHLRLLALRRARPASSRSPARALAGRSR